MSKSRNNIPRAAIHVGAPAKSFSAAEGYEPETLRLTAEAKSFLLVPIPCHFMSVCRNA